MHSDAKSLIARGDRLFSEKRPLDLRNQEIADNFYPERADFTVQRDIGDDWAAHLMTGYPAMVRRDLGNSFGSMLRPSAKHWFKMRSDREEREDHAAKLWLEDKTGTMRRAMADRMSQFTRATKEADHDFAAFGGAVISTEINRRDNTLLYRCWHLRDTAWAEDAYGQVAEVHRQWKPTVADLSGMFKDKCSDKVKELAASPNERGRKIKCRHVAIRADNYTGAKKWRTPYVSLYIDCDNGHVMEEVGSWTLIYTIPRWATISGSQYAYSPAALIALPDARLIQAMTLTLLDAGERAANPPLVGVAEAIRGDMNIYPGGFTAIDAEYDERLGEVLRPLTTDSRGLPFGIEMTDRAAQQLREAFYLNTLGLPPRGGAEMTAFEVGQRVQEYIRQAMPLFEPMEVDYNGALCDITFETLFREGAFGAAEDIPDSLRGQNIQFTFESPLADAVEREKGQLFLEAKAMTAAAEEAEPGVSRNMDFSATMRDVLTGIGVPAKWMRSPAAVEAERQEREKMQAMQSMVAQAQQGADVANTLGDVAQKFAAPAGVM